MANKAFVIDSRGLKVFIHKNQLTKADLGKSFFCCGYSKEKGDYCEAPLGVSSSGHFYQAKHSHPHAPDCPYSKRNSESRVSVLDTRAKDLKIAELLYRIGLEKDAPSVSSAGPRTPKPPEKKDEEGDLSKLVVQRRQHPKNVSQLVDLLSSLMLDDLYADTTVGKIILDQRNEADYRENGIPENSPMVILARKTKPSAFGVKVGRDQWLLADYWAIGKNLNHPILLLLNVNDKARKMLADCTKFDKTAKIAVFSRWRKDPQYENVYVSSYVNRQHIDIIPDDKD